MRTITLSAVTQRRLERLAAGRTFVRQGTRRSDGLLDVPVDEEVFAALVERRAAGESEEDVVLRLIRERDAMDPAS